MESYAPYAIAIGSLISATVAVLTYRLTRKDAVENKPISETPPQSKQAGNSQSTKMSKSEILVARLASAIPERIRVPKQNAPPEVLLWCGFWLGVFFGGLLAAFMLADDAIPLNELLGFLGLLVGLVFAIRWIYREMRSSYLSAVENTSTLQKLRDAIVETEWGQLLNKTSPVDIDDKEFDRPPTRERGE